jgi:C4-dicarboxylate-binding protein DctP
MKEATQKEREWAAELDKEQFNKIKEYADKTGKLKIYHLNDEQKKAWKDVMSKIYPKFYDKDKIGKDLIEAALNTK